jgi:hypothetical protein
MPSNYTPKPDRPDKSSAPTPDQGEPPKSPKPDPDNPLSHPPRGPGIPKKPGWSQPGTTARVPDEIRDRGYIPKGAA